MKKSFFILLFSVIGFSFLTAQEKTSEPVQKQTNTINQEKLQKVEAAKRAKTSGDQPVSKSQLKTTQDSNATYKKESANYEQKRVSEIKKSKAIEPSSTDEK